jgi:hypothetical protein
VTGALACALSLMDWCDPPSPHCRSQTLTTQILTASDMFKVFQYPRSMAAAYPLNQERTLAERGAIQVLYSLCLRASELPLLGLSQLSETNQGNASLAVFMPKTSSEKPATFQSGAYMDLDSFIALMEVFCSSTHASDLAIFRSRKTTAVYESTPIFPGFAAAHPASVSVGLSKIYRGFMEGSGLVDEDYLHPSSHDLRSSGINIAQTKGAGDRSVQQMAGHSGSDEAHPRSTLYTNYSKIDPVRQQSGKYEVRRCCCM